MNNKQLKLFNSPMDILNISIITARRKVSIAPYRTLLLSILAGLYIAFAGLSSTISSFSLLKDTTLFSLGKFISGSVFSVGLIFIVICGGELFTGNCLISTGVMDGSVNIKRFLKNLILVYFGNFIGAISLAFIIYGSGILEGSNSNIGAFFVKIAADKVNIGPLQCQVLGLLCNILVCLGILISYSSTTISGKILGIYFPIMTFVVCGFEHCVANMFYIPLGLMAKSNPNFISLSGVSEEALSNLTWIKFFTNNLIPVTFGNICGGVLIGILYWVCYHKKKAEKR